MNKRILCLCFILIAFLGMSCVSACDADNITIDNSNFVHFEPDSFHSLNSGVRLDDGQVLDLQGNIVSESGMDEETYVNLSEDNSPSIQNDVKSNISNKNYNERAKITKAVEDSLRSNQTKFVPFYKDMNLSDMDLDFFKKLPESENNDKNLSDIDLNSENDDTNLSDMDLNSLVVDIKPYSFDSGTFLSKVKDKDLIALDFNPETGILKVNPNCPYMKSNFVNSTVLKWYVGFYNNDYLNESDRYRTYSSEIGDGYPTRYSKEFNLTEFIKNGVIFGDFPLCLTDGYYTCKITVDVLGAKDFSIDFAFPIRVDDFYNLKYLPLEKSVAHISGKDIKIYDNHQVYLSVFGIFDSEDMIKSLICEQLKKNN